MNNSLHRLIDGMVATLRSEVIPHIGSEFARGQVFGVIYMLNSIRLRAEWSAAFFQEQIAAQMELRETLIPLVETLGAPALPEAAPAGAGVQAMEALRDGNDGRACELIVWLADNRGRIGEETASAIDAALQHYMNRQLKLELSTSAKPMFAEISSGAE
jgi:hypothetical protein